MTSADTVTRPTPGLSAEFAACTEEFARTQNALLEKLQNSNRKWADRLQAEVKLFSELSAKLSAARSIPETAAAYQTYATQHMVMASEDARHLFEDCQAIAESGVRLWSANWPVR
jgi:hypothetical protein